MIPILHLNIASERQRVEQLWAELRLNAVDAVLERGERIEQSQAVKRIMTDVAQRGDAALVDSARQFDDPNFTAEQLRVMPEEMSAAAARLPADQVAALRR